MTIAPSYDSEAIMRRNGGDRARTYQPGDAEPPVGTTLKAGAPVGLGDNLRFDHLDNGPEGWVERVNGNPRGRRVPWSVVRFWLPMRGTA